MGVMGKFLQIMSACNNGRIFAICWMKGNVPLIPGDKFAICHKMWAATIRRGELVIACYTKDYDYEISVFHSRFWQVENILNHSKFAEIVVNHGWLWMWTNKYQMTWIREYCELCIMFEISSSERCLDWLSKIWVPLAIFIQQKRMNNKQITSWKTDSSKSPSAIIKRTYSTHILLNTQKAEQKGCSNKI